MMSTLALETGQPFTISKSYTKEDCIYGNYGISKEILLRWNVRWGCMFISRLAWNIQGQNISKDEALCLTDATQRNECKRLDIVLHLKSPETPEPSTEPSIEPHRISEFCESLITSLQGINHCQNCQASPPLSCDTVCTTTTTLAETTTTSSSKTTAATTSSYIEHSLRQEKAKEDGLQTSAVVIISVVSFIAGIFSTITTVFFIQVRASSEIKMQSVEMTYERLTSNIGNDDKVIKEHVYHGLGTNLESNNQLEVTYMEENISKGDFRDNFQQRNSKTGDHVYNALEIKEHAGLDRYNARTETYSELTYKGLANREDEGSVPLDEGTGNSGTNDRSNEGHYFILEKTNGNERRVTLGGVEVQESNIDGKTEDNLKDGDHDYFNLEKMDDSDLPTHIVKQNDDVRIVETEENAYHILEKV